MQALAKWLKWLFDLISGKRPNSAQKSFLLETINSTTNRSIARSFRRLEIPGKVANWQLWHPDCGERSFMLFTLDEIRDVKRGLKNIPKEIEEELKDPQGRTHVLAIVWVAKIKKKTFATTHRTWLADLQGEKMDVNAYGISVLRFVILELTRMPDIPLDWQTRMQSNKWEELIESKYKVVGKSLRLKKIRPINFEA